MLPQNPLEPVCVALRRFAFFSPQDARSCVHMSGSGGNRPALSKPRRLHATPPYPPHPLAKSGLLKTAALPTYQNLSSHTENLSPLRTQEQNKTGLKPSNQAKPKSPPKNQNQISTSKNSRRTLREWTTIKTCSTIQPQPNTTTSVQNRAL